MSWKGKLGPDCDDLCETCHARYGYHYGDVCPYEERTTHKELNNRDGESALVNDPVNHPAHYTKHPSGVECIQITEHMGFNLGNAIKYIWRADLKGSAVNDLEKAKWYVTREIEKRQRGGDS